MTGTKGASPEAIIRDIKRKTRRKFTAEEKIRIVLEGMRGEASISGGSESNLNRLQPRRSRYRQAGRSNPEGMFQRKRKGKRGASSKPARAARAGPNSRSSGAIAAGSVFLCLVALAEIEL
jgi:transposase-like protein